MASIIQPSSLPRRPYGKERLPYSDVNYPKSIQSVVRAGDVLQEQWSIPIPIEEKTRLLAKGINDLRDEIYADISSQNNEETSLKVYWERIEYRFLPDLEFPEFVMHLDLELHKGRYIRNIPELNPAGKSAMATTKMKDGSSW